MMGTFAHYAINALSSYEEGHCDIVVVGWVFHFGSPILSDRIERIISNYLSERFQADALHKVKGVSWLNLYFQWLPVVNRNCELLGVGKYFSVLARNSNITFTITSMLDYNDGKLITVFAVLFSAHCVTVFSIETSNNVSVLTILDTWWVNRELARSSGALSNLSDAVDRLSGISRLRDFVLKFSSMVSLASSGGKCPVIEIYQLFFSGDYHWLEVNAWLNHVDTTSVGREHGASPWVDFVHDAIKVSSNEKFFLYLKAFNFSHRVSAICVPLMANCDLLEVFKGSSFFQMVSDCILELFPVVLLASRVNKLPFREWDSWLKSL